METQQLLTWILGLVISIATIITVAAAGIRWLVKHYFNELRPNSGSSLKDQVSELGRGHDRLESKQEKLDEKLDRIMDTLLDFISRSK